MTQAEIAALLAAAESVRFRMDLGNGCDAGTVAAALRTRSGAIHTGICLDLACGIGTCAEHAAVAEMLKHREREIAAIVAVSKAGVLPPCGRCRELLAQVSPQNMATEVILGPASAVPLRELLPRSWLAAKAEAPRCPADGSRDA